MRAHEDTPAKEPQKNGISEECMGIQAGVGPCSPDGRRPMICRSPSYSKKYSAVPEVSRTTASLANTYSQGGIVHLQKCKRNPVYNPMNPFVRKISRTASSVFGGLPIFNPLAAAMEYSSCRRTWKCVSV